MSYTALYRKWRPGSFESVVGQDHIVKTLTNQIMAGRIGHAYLFCGTRGTGKTSTAKIFAKAVNCEQPQEGNPCNHCATCDNINNNQNMNIVEIDAASNNGVDNIREIREEVRYTPTEGKYKVYIVDEVHMLSTGAFNALLKTLEEPPSHVIFILATTEPHKLPATILSRCQRYDFHRISMVTVADTLMRYLIEENIEAENNAIRYVAKAADGSMRDALSILDQCIAFYLGEKITLEKVLDVLGAVDTNIFIHFVSALHGKDIKGLMVFMEQIINQGRELSQFVVDLMQYLRNLLIIKSVEDASDILELSKEDIEALKEQSEFMHEDEMIYYIKVFSELESRIKFASQKRVLIEIELMKLCNPSMNTNHDGLMERIRHLEKKIEEGIVVTTTVEREVKEEKKPEQIKKTVDENAIPKDIKEAILRFDALIDRLTGLEKAVLKKVVPANLEDDFLYLICEDDIQKNQLTKPQFLENINNILAEIHHKSFQLRIMTAKEYNLLAHETKNTTTGVEEARNLFEIIKSKINFDIQQI